MIKVNQLVELALNLIELWCRLEPIGRTIWRLIYAT